MSNAVIQAQWSLSATSDTFVSVLKGFLIAASSDSVQTLAMVSCERFGSTIAITNETILKVERILIPSPDPALIGFMKATVGFYRDDCPTQLGRTPAGVRFLGLAAALVTSLGPFEGAKAIDVMLRSSTTDLTAVPKLLHLKDLLKSVEARSYRCGFADSIVGWQILLNNEVLPYIFPVEEIRQGFDEAHLQKLKREILGSVPSPEAIGGLVDVFRQLARMGPSTILGATIRVGVAAPWILAFTQWCIGPPSVYVEGQPRVIGQPRSRVKVVVPSALEDLRKPFEVTIHHQLQDITQMLGPPSQNLTSGMVTIESYQKWLLQNLGFDGKDMLRMVHEALSYAIPQVLSKMICPKYARLGQMTNSGRFLGSIDNWEDGCRLSPLPDIHTIAHSCMQILNLSTPMQFSSLGNMQLIADLPLVSRHLKSLMEKCQCERCCRSTQRYTEPRVNRTWCQKSKFFLQLSFLMIDIFALSLFDSPSPLLIRLWDDRPDGSTLETTVADVIETGDPQEFDDTLFLGWARNLVGHTYHEEDQEWIMSYGKGQVIFPAVLGTFEIEKQGYHKLYALPGTLRFQDNTYEVVSLPLIHVSDNKEDVDFDLPPFPAVSRSANLFRELEVVWDITVQDNKELHAKILLRSRSTNTTLMSLSPCDILLQLKNTLLLDGCPHNSRSQLESADGFASYSSPWDDHSEAKGSTSRVDVVAVDGANDLRCFALARANGPAVLRKNSCLACCLNVCRDTGIHILIL